MPRKKQVAKTKKEKILESNYRVEPAFGQIAQDAFTIYRQMLNASHIFQTNICSLCADKPLQARKHFHGSEFGMCVRQVQLNQINMHISNKDDNLKNIFLYDGHLHEEAAMKLLLGAGYEISLHDEEIIIERGNVKIVSHPDLLLHTPEQNLLIEFKALKDWGIKNKFQENLIPNQYYGQCQIYLESLNLEYCLLFFKSRHTSEIFAPFVIKRDPIYIGKRFRYLENILLSTEQITMAPKEFKNKDCDACTFCQWYSTCWEG